MLTVHVPFQVTRLRNWFLTDLTLEWLCSSVSELMCLEMYTLVEGLTAFSALERPFPAVDSRVVYQVMLTDKWFVAYFTLVWLSSSVHELMFSERSTLIEWPIALSALEGSLRGSTIVWFLSTVGEHVSFQVTFSSKWFVAYGTFVWFLPSVGEHVYRQVPIFFKWLCAYLTFVSFLLGVGEHVRLQVCIYSKWLIADFTLELLCSSVSELMFLEIWKLVEGLVALCALERLFSTVDLLVLYKVWGICNWFATLATLGTFVRLQDFWSRNLLGTFWEFWSSTKWVFCTECWFWLKMSNLNTSIKWVYCTECWLDWLIGILVHQQNG